MLKKTKVSCLVKTDILSVMTPTFFARFFKRYALLFYFIKHMPKMSGFRVTPPPTLNFGEDLPPFDCYVNLIKEKCFEAQIDILICV